MKEEERERVFEAWEFWALDSALKECLKPGNVGLWILLWWNTEGLCHSKYLEYEEDAKQLNLLYKRDHLQLRNPCTTDG